MKKWLHAWRMRLRERGLVPEHLRTGEWGESVAERFLVDAGLRCIGRRVRVGRRDEIDLIMGDGEILIFVEVKTRASEGMGRPFAAVNASKRRSVGRAAMRYMQRLKQKPPYFRFDVVEVVGRPEEGDPVVRHITNAFSLPKGYRVPW